MTTADSGDYERLDHDLENMIKEINNDSSHTYTWTQFSLSRVTGYRTNFYYVLAMNGEKITNIMEPEEASIALKTIREIYRVLRKNAEASKKTATTTLS